MRLIHVAEGGTKLGLTEANDRDLPKYAILSHKWGDEELTFREMQDGSGAHKEGYQKIQQCCVTASPAYQYVWADTCCIDKTSSAELSEAINSMYHWYEEADVCYAYLADVPANAFRESRWFTRGWTLQELLAPKQVIFFDSEWKVLGTRDSLRHEISERTNIPLDILSGARSLDSMSIAQRMSWASQRETSRVEDQAYCLFGIFGINMPLLYGEGEKAFIRLQEAIMDISDDHTIFAWKNTDNGRTDGGLLATSPAAFRESHDIVVKSKPSFATKVPWRLDNKGLHLELYTMAVGRNGLLLAILPCTEVGAEEDWMGIYLRDKSLTMENFERVCSSELAPVDLRLFRPAQYPLRALCVQRQRSTTLGGRRIAGAHSSDYEDNIEIHPFSSGSSDMQAGQAKIPPGMESDHTTLSYAAKEGDLQNTWALLSEPRAWADQPTSDGRTPLSFAAEGGHVDVVWLLLTRSDVDPFSMDVYHMTPALYAARNGHNQIVEIFLARKNSQNDIQDPYKRTLLSHAAEGGHTDTVKMLASRSDSDADLGDTEGQTPLSWAARSGNVNVVCLLVEYGADANAKDSNGRTPIWHAVAHGQTETIGTLIGLGADVKEQVPFSLPESRNEWREIIEVLAALGATFHPNDESGSSVLIWAAENRQHALLDTLLASVVSIEQPDNQERTILSWALENEDRGVFDKLVACGININSNSIRRPGPEDSNAVWRPGPGDSNSIQRPEPADSNSIVEETSLAWAARSKRYDMFEMLVKQGVDVNPPGTFLPDIANPLDWAIKEPAPKLFKLLLEHGAEPNSVDIWGVPLLSNAVTEKELHGFVPVLLEHGASPDFAGDDWAPLYAATREGDTEMARLLLEHGADPNIQVQSTEALIYFAVNVGDGHYDIVSLLLDHGADANGCNQYRMKSALAEAVDKKHKRLVKLLLSRGADPNFKDDEGEPPLTAAVRNNGQQMAALLLEHGADPNVRDYYGVPAVVEAAEWGKKFAKLLISHGADPHVTDSEGRTASQYA